jgi:hypothetical protein
MKLKIFGSSVRRNVGFALSDTHTYKKRGNFVGASVAASYFADSVYQCAN